MGSHTPTAYVNAIGRYNFMSKPSCLKHASYSRLWQRRFYGNGSRKDLPHHSSRTACSHSSSRARATTFITRATAAPPMPNTQTQLHEDTPSPSPSTPRFSWERYWWPIMPLSYLDPTRPTAAELLGIPLVLWRDGSGTWRCFQDLCPHRLAPLTEGRIEDGQLMCSYHGWRFEGGGSCTTIPQAPDAKTHSVATSSPRACARAFPTKEAAGLLWVWPDASPSAAEDSAAATPPISRYMRDKDVEGAKFVWFMRDTPYSYEVLLENVADPSHLPFAHHKALPTSPLNRYKAGAMPFHGGLEDDECIAASPDASPVAAFGFPSLLSPDGQIRVYAPSFVTYQYMNAFGPWTVNVYTVPSGPERSRLFIGTAIVVTKPFKAKPSLVSLQRALGTKFLGGVDWMDHLTNNNVVDGDNTFLAMQSRTIRARQAAAAGGPTSPSTVKPVWQSDYFMPISCDRAVVEARKWIDTVGGGGPTYAVGAEPQPLGSRREMNDRWQSHGRHCRHCQEAERRLNIAVDAAKGIIAAAVFALCALVGHYGPLGLMAGGGPSLATAAVVLVGAGMAVAVRKLCGLLEKFHYVEYIHADRD